VVLKCPFHLWHPKELAAAYPHARVVRLHRDPATTIASVCSLTATIRAARAYHVDRAELGDHWLARTKEALLERGADDGGLPVLDMRYPDLVADPVSVVRRVCEFAGLPFHGEAETRVRRAVRPPAGGHHYRLEDFGLDATRTALAFAAYRAAYDL
jgi:LPS sulfotransferase NodH